jgi:hypothetical protein
MRPESIYTAVLVGLVAFGLARRLRAGRMTPVAAALVSAAVSPAAVTFVPVPHLTFVSLLVAGLYMMGCEVADRAANTSDPGG